MQQMISRYNTASNPNSNSKISLRCSKHCNRQSDSLSCKFELLNNHCSTSSELLLLSFLHKSIELSSVVIDHELAHRHPWETIYGQLETVTCVC